MNYCSHSRFWPFFLILKFQTNIFENIFFTFHPFTYLLYYDRCKWNWERLLAKRFIEMQLVILWWRQLSICLYFSKLHLATWRKWDMLLVHLLIFSSQNKTFQCKMIPLNSTVQINWHNVLVSSSGYRQGIILVYWLHLGSPLLGYVNKCSHQYDCQTKA